MAEIFQNRHQNIEHVELSIAAHRMRFSDIAAQMERTIAGVRHRNVWPGLMFQHSPAMFIAAMVIRNIYLRNLSAISQDSLSNAHHHVENRLRIGQ